MTEMAYGGLQMADGGRRRTKAAGGGIADGDKDSGRTWRMADTNN